MFENEIKLLALFFFFATLDDQKAIATASRAADMFYLRMKKSPNQNPKIALVSITKQVWDKSKSNFFRGQPHYSIESGWLLPEGLDLSAWKEFQKNAHEDELLALIWSKVLKIEEADISVALGITEGTLRYRIGRGLRKLGSMSQSPKSKLEIVRSNV